MDTDALFDKVFELYEAGDEQAIRTFLITHVNEFPQEVRDQIVFFFFEEAVKDHAEGLAADLAFKEMAADTLDALGAIKKAIEEQMKTAEVRWRLEKRAKEGE